MIPLLTLSTGLTPVPAGTLLPITDPCAPTNGLVVTSGTQTVSTLTGVLVTRTIVVSNTTDYSFQAVSLSGTVPSSTPLVSISTANATGTWDATSFNFLPTDCLPMSVTLTITSLAAGKFIGTVAVSNDVVLHVSASYTNLVAAMPELMILRSGQNVVLAWPTNYEGFELLCTTNLIGSSWVVAQPPPSVDGENFVITNSLSEDRKFYRLHLPEFVPAPTPEAKSRGAGSRVEYNRLKQALPHQNPMYPELR